MTQVRLALESDREALCVLFRRHCDEFAPHLGFDEEITQASLTQALETGDPVCYVAEMDGEIVGYITARIWSYPYTTGHYVEHELLYVRPENRGSRAAVRLIQAFIRWGRVVGAREWFAGTSTGYKPARVARLFELCGGTVAGYSIRGVL